MATITGTLRKMKTELAKEVRYFLRCGDVQVSLNECIAKSIEIQFTNVIHCIQCGRQTKKSFQQGYCFPCLCRLQECNLCTIHPERCLVESQGCPKDNWAHEQCHQTHIVYLANSSALKVGITRHTHVPTRWIDQGAVQALPIIQVPNRYQSGMVEMILKKYVSDKTNWRQMLKGPAEEIDLRAERDRLLSLAQKEIQCVKKSFKENGLTILENAEVVTINYPVQHYPKKITSLSLDKTPNVHGVLQGIKGQYLLLDRGVMNIRKFGGYEITIKI